MTGSGSAVVGGINRLDWGGSSAARLHQEASVLAQLRLGRDLVQSGGGAVGAGSCRPGVYGLCFHEETAAWR